VRFRILIESAVPQSLTERFGVFTFSNSFCTVAANSYGSQGNGSFDHCVKGTICPLMEIQACFYAVKTLPIFSAKPGGDSVACPRGLFPIHWAAGISFCGAVTEIERAIALFQNRY